MNSGDEHEIERVPRRRGRPRDDELRRRALAAAAALIADAGPTAVTMEAVAAAAGIGKPTLYRYWSNRHELAMAALIAVAPTPPRPDAATEGAPLTRLRAQLGALVRLFATPGGRGVATLLAAADRDSEIARAFRSHFIQARRQEGAELLAEAAAAGDLDPATDLDTALDMVYGAVFYRLMMGHRPLDAAFAERVVDLAVTALAPPGRRRAATPP